MGQVCPPLGSRSSKICLIGDRSARNKGELVCLLSPRRRVVLWTALNAAGETEQASPGGSDGKEPACDVGDVGVIPGSGRSAGGGNGSPLQCSCLGIPVDRGASRATDPVQAAHGCGALVGEPLGHFAQSLSPMVSEMLFLIHDPKQGCFAVKRLSVSCFLRKKACAQSDRRSINVSFSSPEAERHLPPWMW